MKNLVRLFAIMLAVGAVSQTVSTYGSDSESKEAVQNWQELKMNVSQLLQNKEFIRQVNWSADSGNPQAQELRQLLERYWILESQVINSNYESNGEPGP